MFESVTKSVGLEDRKGALRGRVQQAEPRLAQDPGAAYPRGHLVARGLQPANAPGAPVNVVFEPSRRKIGNLFAEALSQPIGDNIKSLGQTYVLPRPVNVVFRTAAS